MDYSSQEDQIDYESIVAISDEHNDELKSSLLLQSRLQNATELVAEYEQLTSQLNELQQDNIRYKNEYEMKSKVRDKLMTKSMGLKEMCDELNSSIENLNNQYVKDSTDLMKESHKTKEKFMELEAETDDKHLHKMIQEYELATQNFIALNEQDKQKCDQIKTSFKNNNDKVKLSDLYFLKAVHTDLQTEILEEFGDISTIQGQVDKLEQHNNFMSKMIDELEEKLKNM